MSNTYQAGLKFERITAGVYRVINTNGRIIANITRETFSNNPNYPVWNNTFWMIKVNYLSPEIKKTLSDAKKYISDPSWKHLHKANPDKAGKFAIA